jgi:hypothetical protein
MQYKRCVRLSTYIFYFYYYISNTTRCPLLNKIPHNVQEAEYKEAIPRHSAAAKKRKTKRAKILSLFKWGVQFIRGFSLFAGRRVLEPDPAGSEGGLNYFMMCLIVINVKFS